MTNTKRSGASERQKQFEDRCRVIASELLTQVAEVPLPTRLIAMGNISDLFDCIRDSYGNGRADEKEGIPEV